MSGQLFPSAREKFLTAQLSWLTGVYKAVLLPESFIPDFDDENLDDIFAGVRIAVSDEITGRTATKGVANSDPFVFGTLVDNRRVAKMVLFKDTGDETTSSLICFFDTENLIGTPLTLEGLEYFFVPDALEGGLFRL